MSNFSIICCYYFLAARAYEVYLEENLIYYGCLVILLTEKVCTHQHNYTIRSIAAISLQQVNGNEHFHGAAYV